jgi:predicted nucleotidyltransferase
VNRDEILARLRAHEQELRALGVQEVALFGSVARGDDTPQSDVDMLVSITPEAELSLLGMVRIERRLRELAGRDVDLVEREMLRAPVMEEIARETVRAF